MEMAEMTPPMRERDTGMGDILPPPSKKSCTDSLPWLLYALHTPMPTDTNNMRLKRTVSTVPKWVSEDATAPITPSPVAPSSAPVREKEVVAVVVVVVTIVVVVPPDAVIVVVAVVSVVVVVVVTVNT